MTGHDHGLEHSLLNENAGSTHHRALLLKHTQDPERHRRKVPLSAAVTVPKRQLASVDYDFQQFL
jgi:hypothetical protein